MTELGRLVGIGRTAEVFAYGDGRVVKLLRPGFPDHLAEEEDRIAEIVATTYPAAPRCDGLVRIDGRLGVVMERLSGPSMDVLARSRLWQLDRLARSLGQLHAAMHDRDGVGLPEQRPALHAAVTRAEPMLTAAAAAATHERIDGLPTGTSICHGDLHPANVIVGSRTVVIDWGNASRGSAVADVARSIYLMRDAAQIDSTPRVVRVLVQAVRGRFCRGYLAAYRANRPLDLAELRAWRLPILGARLAEGIAEERESLLAEIDREVAARLEGRA